MWIVVLGIEPIDFVCWSSRATAPCAFTLLPDGCRDIVVTTAADGACSVDLTDLDFQPRRVALTPGAELVGFRIKPGLCIDKDALSDVRRAADVRGLIADAAATQSEVPAAIATLASGAQSPTQVANHLGVSLRSLQRQFRKLGLPPPDFWRVLGRARRAATALAEDLPLADIAGVHGFADQAHMTRDCRAWLGHAPGQIRCDSALAAQLAQPALGAWIDEQISIR